MLYCSRSRVVRTCATTTMTLVTEVASTMAKAGNASAGAIAQIWKR